LTERGAQQGRHRSIALWFTALRAPTASRHVSVRLNRYSRAGLRADERKASLARAERRFSERPPSRA